MRRDLLLLTATACGLATLWTPDLARAQTSYPMLTRVSPAAAQRGKTVDVTITGLGLFEGAWEVLCEEGLSATDVEVVATKSKVQPNAPKNKGMRQTGSVKAKLSVAPDAPLGPRELRVATPQGISSVGLIVVVDDPVAVESDDKGNDLPGGAQALDLPTVASGVIEKIEDVDWYVFKVNAGETVAFSVWANRLQNKIHDLQTHFDPIIAIHDEQGRELAVNDNHNFADPLLIHQFKESGTYRIQIRDTTYTGNAYWSYVMHATNGPVITSTHPLAINPGSEATFEVLGSQVGSGTRTQPLKVAENLEPGIHLTSLPTEHGPALPVPLYATPLPLGSETDDAPDEVAKAPVLKLPVAFSGRLLESNDVDTHQFEAKAGQVYRFEVFARRLGSMTDPLIRVLDLKGKALAEADDAPDSKDPLLEWTAPADGTYGIHVQDLHNRGGEGFGYLLLAEPASPTFTLYSDPDKINLGPGARVPVFVRVTRKAKFTGPVTIEWEGLPEGVSASPLTISPTMTQGVSVVSASTDAKHVAALLKIKGRAQVDGKDLVVASVPKQEIYLPGGGRGLYAVQTVGLAVTDESDITVEATPKELTIKPGSTVTIDVKVTRHGGYDQGVNLALLLKHLGGTFADPLPAGVTIKEAGSKTLLGPKETEGKIILEAKADAAACENVPIAVMGHVSINFVVKTAYSSDVLNLSVAKP